MTARPLPQRHPASFRDPAGFICEHAGELYRLVHPDAVADVDALLTSGLHDELVLDGLMVPHARATADDLALPPGWIALRPERLPVISYACEWTAAQLQAAALLTLELQRRALRHGMSLKDASSFNVQFVGARPTFIDVLSFTRSAPASPWFAYRQFCEHFLAPLALRRHRPGFEDLARAALDGVPIGLASQLLPLGTWLQPGLAMHLHLHAKSAQRASSRSNTAEPPRAAAPLRAASPDFGLRLVDSLEHAVRRLLPKRESSAWSEYRGTNTYTADDAAAKLAFVREAMHRAAPRRALDLGANDGHYARAIVAAGVPCTAIELDAACCEAIYAGSLAPELSAHLNTLRVDLTNPTPPHGWASAERASFVDRLRCDMTFALALVHHLSIARQVPFDSIADLLASLSPHAVVEYVPLDDPMARRLLGARTGVTDSYLATLSEASFMAAFDRHFDCVQRSERLAGGRRLHHFVRRPA